MAKHFSILFLFLCAGIFSVAQSKQEKNEFAVIAYYAGNTETVSKFDYSPLTHVIFSFCHLKGNRLSVDNARDTATIRALVALKAKHPSLKVILSLGGWGGCEKCSPVFASAAARQEFAASTKQLMDYLKADGIDLDWEYPAISGHPGHPFMPADKDNFTELVKALRKSLGNKQEISFAAGGFTSFIDSSIDWKVVMPLIDRVNLMSYDLTNGFSTTSGHHTPLYSTPQQIESTDHGVNMLLEKGVPANKIVVGAAFYARLFAISDTLNKGLYRPAKFHHGISASRFADSLTTANGFELYWDETAQAPYGLNAKRKLLLTYDDKRSVQLKTAYAKKRKLNGIMFWQLVDDSYRNGLLDAIDKAVKKPE